MWPFALFSRCRLIITFPLVLNPLIRTFPPSAFVVIGPLLGDRSGISSSNSPLLFRIGRPCVLSLFRFCPPPKVALKGVIVTVFLLTDPFFSLWTKFLWKHHFFFPQLSNFGKCPLYLSSLRFGLLTFRLGPGSLRERKRFAFLLIGFFL